MYWRPRRCTLVELRLLPDVVWGQQIVAQLHTSEPKRSATPLAAYQLFREMGVTEQIKVRLFKLVVFDRRSPNWRPDKLLLTCPMDDVLEGEWIFEFWLGGIAELEDDKEAKRKENHRHRSNMSSRNNGDQARIKCTGGLRQPRVSKLRPCDLLREPSSSTTLARCQHYKTDFQSNFKMPPTMGQGLMSFGVLMN